MYVSGPPFKATRLSNLQAYSKVRRRNVSSLTHCLSNCWEDTHHVTDSYRSESYRDPKTKKPRSHRTYLGRVDPVTHTIVEKAEQGKRNRSNLGEEKKTEKEAAKRIELLEKQIEKLNAEMTEMRSSIKEYQKKLSQINRISGM